MRLVGIFILAVVSVGTARAQDRWGKLDAWMEDNTKDMGGRAILVVYKDGRVAYMKSVNDMSRRQKMVNKFISRRQGKDVDLTDYTIETRQPIASCSKWLSAALVMTFVEMRNTDFGKRQVAMPAGGAGSTPEDYMHFLVMILDKGVYKGHRLLSEKSIAEMQVNRIGPDVTIAYSPAKSLGLNGLGYGYGEWIMGTAVTSPGLFGSFPWVEKEKGYCAFLMTVYTKNDGRGERYTTLKQLVDEALEQGR